MTPVSVVHASSRFLLQLASPAARALALSGAAALALAAFRVRSTSVRLFTWTAVLYAALVLPFLGWLLPPVSISTPAVLKTNTFQIAAAPVSSPAREVVVERSKAVNKRRDTENSSMTVSSATVSRPFLLSSFLSSIPWSVVAVGIYLGVSFLFLVRFFVGLAFTYRLRQSSQLIDEWRLISKLKHRASALRLAFIPEVSESEFIAVPVTIGALRSSILLPTGWREWDDAKLAAVVAHEMSHVARRDALTQRLSLLHRAFFWFSPLAWWLDRHLGNLAEQASDEAALACGADRTEYARTLLGFFEALQGVPGRVRWQGVSMAKAGQAEQRLERILSWKGTVTMNFRKTGVKKSIGLAIIAFAVPVVYLTASVQPANNAPSRAISSRQDVAPQAVPAVAPVPASSSLPAPVPLAPVAPAAALPVPVAPVAEVAQAETTVSSMGRGYSYSYGYDDEQRFVIVSGKSDSLTMSGSMEDAHHVEKLKKSIPGDFIWFERDEKSYIIRDQATIDRARKLWAPQEELGRKQEELGKQQEALGKQQEELGAKMEQVHVKVPDMTAEIDKLRAELKQLNSSATVEQVGQIQSEIGELQSKIGEIQSKAGEEQGKLGEQEGALGEKQGKLGEQQGELGRQQGELAKKASREMKQLLDEAIAKGIAQPEV
jgi:beta-lactamase regulating signal transducer with metallopeptidase domain